MQKLYRNKIFLMGLATGVSAILTVLLIGGVALLGFAPRTVVEQQRLPSPRRIGMEKWSQQGKPIAVTVEYTGQQASELSGIAFDGYRLWVTGRSTSEVDGYVYALDPATSKTEARISIVPTQTSTSTASAPRGVLFDGAHIWVADRGADKVVCFTPEYAGDGEAKPELALRSPISLTQPSSPYYLAYDGDDVWVTDRDRGALWWLSADKCAAPDDDSDPDRLISKVMINGKEERFSRPFGILYDGEYLWVTNRGSNEIFRLKPGSCEGDICEDVRVIEVGPSNSEPMSLAYDGKYIWVTLRGLDQVARIHPLMAEIGRFAPFANQITRFAPWASPIAKLIDVGNEPWGLAFDGVYIWVANNGDESVSRIHATDGVVAETFDTDGAASRLAFDGAFMWVTNFSTEEGLLTRR